MKYLSLLFILILLSIYMIVIAADQTPYYIPCETPLQQSSLLITEVMFDGSDEWIELTNMGSEQFSGTIILSGVKTTPLTYNIVVESMSSLLVGDSMAGITGDIVMLTGQGFSLSDSTGFTLRLFQDTSLLQEVTFSKDQIVLLPNNYGYHLIVSGTDILRIATSGDTSIYTTPPMIANPGVVFCINMAITPIIPIDTGSIENTGDIVSEIIDTGDSMSGEITTGDTDTLLSGQIELSNDTMLLQDLPCTITEIHASSNQYPEYIELYCSSFSGYLFSQGLGVGDAIKTIPINTLGGYYIISSSISGFSDTTPIITIPGLSLKDDGESLLLFGSGFITGTTQFPEYVPNQSYYPQSLTHLLSTPGFDEYYVLAFSIQPTTPLPVPYVASPIPTTTTTGSYYSLYQKRKTTAETYKNDISVLKKEKSTLTKDITRLQKELQSALKKISTNTLSSETSKTTKAAISLQSKATSSTKSTPISSTKKGSTISTTSKSYQKLINEHKIYSLYVDYMQKYLKSHLYKQYTTLGVDTLQKRLQTVLKASNNQQTTITGQSGEQIPLLDYITINSGASLTTPQSSIPSYIIKVGYSLRETFATIFSTLFLANGDTNDTVQIGQKLSDIGNDIMDIKTSETNFLPSE